MPDSPYRGSPFFNPPAPSCEVVISHNNKSQAFQALIDSGANLTCIPSAAVGNLNLRKLREIPVSGATGQDETEGLYVVNIEFMGIDLPNHPVISLSKRPYMLIGRDILNRYTSIHAGPALTFTIQTA